MSDQPTDGPKRSQDLKNELARIMADVIAGRMTPREANARSHEIERLLLTKAKTS